MNSRTIAAGLTLSLAALSLPSIAVAQTQTFDISRFDIRGNTLLSPDQLEALVSPFKGPGRVYGDIQKALEALENAYRTQGFGTVNVHVPEQEITTGTIRLDVSEATIGTVVITGNQHFDTANIRASLPNLREGAAPNLRQISENVQLINENPAKQIEVTLGMSEQEGKVDAKVAVTEQDPQRVYLTLDNSGTAGTGRHRLGVAYQDANLFGGDEMLTLAYTTSPDIWMNQPDGIKVGIYSIAYRQPLYGLGDSIDFIYGSSNVNTPSAQNTGFGISGKGEVMSLRWNHLFPRQGEYASRLVFGIDNKHINTTCDPIAGVDQKGVNPSCTPYTVRPVSVAYTGQWQGGNYQAGMNVGLAWNVPTGTRYAGTAGSPAAGRNDRYSFVANRPVSDDFSVLRFGGNYAYVLDGWQLRAAVTGQHTSGGLPSAEQLGLAGSSAVRGFDERAVSTDSGHVVNLEAYTPNWAGSLDVPGTLLGVVFLDHAYGRNHGAQGMPFDRASIASAGVGLRYAPSKDVNLSVDMADVIDQGPNNIGRRNSWGGHFKMTIAF